MGSGLEGRNKEGLGLSWVESVEYSKIKGNRLGQKKSKGLIYCTDWDDKSIGRDRVGMAVILWGGGIH